MLRALSPLLFLALSISVPARSKSAPSRLESDYIQALATANHFLYAWQTLDHETTILLLSDRLKQHTPESHLDIYLRSSTIRPRSFEIGRGKKLAAGRYRIPVTLFHPATELQSVHPDLTSIIVIKRGKNDWAIDKLP